MSSASPQSEAAAGHDIAAALFARVPQLAGVQAQHITPLRGGITNTNYRITTAAADFVLRIAGERTDTLGIDRRVEHAANCSAAAAGIAPGVVHMIEPEGYLVTNFIAGRMPLPEELRSAHWLGTIGALLRRIHALPALGARFSGFEVVRTYTRLAREVGAEFPANFDSLLAALGVLEQALARRVFIECPCHNDLLNGNFLVDAHERLFVLDWEYAGMGDPFFDLGNFSAHHELLPAHDMELLAAYGATDAADLARLNLMKIVSDFREAIWGVLQSAISGLDFDFREYASTYFGRVELRLQEPALPAWLAQV